MNTTKTIVVVAATWLSSATPMLAATPDADSEELNSIEFCIVLGDIAERVMKFRQEGGSMSTLMQALAQSGSKDAMIELSMRVVQDAFEISRFSSPEYQRREIVDFRNEVEAACFASM